MFQLRIYTLKNNQSASLYMNKYWKKHLISLPKYGINAEGVFKEKILSNKKSCRVFALISFQKNIIPKDANAKYMESPDFKSDMEGFPMNNILNVESIDLELNSELPFFERLEVK